MNKIFRHFPAKNLRPIFLFFPPHFWPYFINISHQTVLDNIFQSMIVPCNFCMIPHSLIFSFNLAHFGLKQNPTGLQEAVQRSDKNSKTTLIIKSTLERSFLMKKHKKIIFGILHFSPDSTQSCNTAMANNTRKHL